MIAVDTFYSRADADALPQDWSTTSDSIAALLANKLALTRVVLVKSCPIPEPFSLEWAARQGVVDRSFIKASRGLRVELRALGGDHG